jgi:surfeit locus 1 family protein
LYLAGRRFAPPLWAWAVFLSTLALLLWLGTWQLQRGSAKAHMLAERAAARQTEPSPLPAPGASVESFYGRAVAARGRYDGGRQILLDNQVRQSRVGYRVWTPLRLEDDGRLVLVDRGWVPLGRDRSAPPRPAAPEGEIAVRGLWRNWPRPGLRLAAPGACEQTGWPRTLNYPSYEQIACQYAGPVADGLLLLDESLPGGFARDWNDLGPPPARHYGYAAQWYALALALAVLFAAWRNKMSQ